MQSVIFCTVFWEESQLKKCKKHSSYATKPVAYVSWILLIISLQFLSARGRSRRELG